MRADWPFLLLVRSLCTIHWLPIEETIMIRFVLLLLVMGLVTVVTAVAPFTVSTSVASTKRVVGTGGVSIPSFDYLVQVTLHQNEENICEITEFEVISSGT
jgi:hypothetical protein